MQSRRGKDERLSSAEFFTASVIAGGHMDRISSALPF